MSLERMEIESKVLQDKGLLFGYLGIYYFYMVIIL